jgi:hypothetical protein
MRFYLKACGENTIITIRDKQQSFLINENFEGGTLESYKLTLIPRI